MRSWNNGMRCMSFYVLIHISNDRTWHLVSNFQLYRLIYTRLKRSMVLVSISSWCELHYTPTQRSWRGVYWFHVVRLSICPSVDRIMSTLYLPQYSWDPFQIYSSHQATPDGVSCIKFFFLQGVSCVKFLFFSSSKLKNLKFWQIL